ncbi:MAG: hypothetical protein ACO3EZ_13315 [Prochlorotrichaceae cyanobacterium]
MPKTAHAPMAMLDRLVRCLSSWRSSPSSPRSMLSAREEVIYETACR